MADMLLSTGLNAMNLGANHFDKVRDPVRDRYRKMRGLEEKPDPDTKDHRIHDEKGYALRKRSEVASDEEIVEVVRHKGQILPRKPSRRPGMARQSSSMDNVRDPKRNNRRGYDSDGSVPPRGRVKPRSESGRSQNRNRKRGSSASSTSSSDLGSSTDEEKKCRKMLHKKWITAALASVATIHAASKVYSSIEAHDKRIVQVERGQLSPEEAHKRQRSARWQDAAAIGIAALGIKGALSEWSEVTEEHAQHKELMRAKEEHHQKRLERARRAKAREMNGYYKGRDGNWYYDGSAMQGSQRSQSKRGSLPDAGGRSELDGPRQGDRKMIEGNNDRNRSVYEDRDDYDRRRDRSRAKSVHDDRNRDRDRDRSRRHRDRDDDDDY